MTDAEPQLIRSAATAIMGLERLPHRTAGICVEFGYRKTERGSDVYEALITLTDTELCASIVERAPDSVSRDVFMTRVGGHKEGGLEKWLYFADQFAFGGQLYVVDQSGRLDW